MKIGARFNTAIELSVLKHTGNFLTDLGITSFSGTFYSIKLKCPGGCGAKIEAGIGNVTNHEHPSSANLTRQAMCV
jgi:hypothetical protein